MPTYVYHCDLCNIDWELVKPISQAQDVELCKNKKCKKIATKILQAPRLNTSKCQFEAHFNHGLGKEIHNPRQIKEELRRIKDQTGKDIVEVGTDNLQSVKKRFRKY